MSGLKCTGCGLVNFASAGECKRCGAALRAAPGGAPGRSVAAAPPVVPDEEGGAADEIRPPRRTLLRRALAVVGMTCSLLFGFYVSLLETSDPATYEQRQLVRRAVDHIERAGLSSDAFLLRRLATYRTSDNWWNRWTGHQEAYAATNFPFEVVTLYPDFFRYAADDRERAVILLHEARHLAGQDEEETLAGVWRDRSKLGWTREEYRQTRVWKNVHEFTRRHVPGLFRCGPDGTQDCTE